MSGYSLKWPPDFDNHAWEIESKGRFAGLEVAVGARIIRPTFYDPVRLAQDVAAEIGNDGIFTEPCLIVIERVTRETIEATVANLAASGALERLP